MVKKIYLYTVLFFTFFIFIITIGNIALYKKSSDTILRITENYQYNFLINESVLNKINLTKSITANYYSYIKDEAVKQKILLIKNNVNKIILLLDTLKKTNFKDYKSFLNNYITRLYNDNIEVINLNNKIIIAKDRSHIGKIYSLPCKPFNKSLTCSRIINNRFHYIKYSKSYNILIESDFELNKIDYNLIISKTLTMLKTVPGIIIYYKNKKIKGVFNNDSFYIFDEFKPLNIFFGYGIKYENIEKMSHIINHELLKSTKPLIIRFIIFFVLGISVFYLILFTVFKKQFTVIQIAIDEYEKKALYDHLTNLYNREGFKKAVKSLPCENFLIIDLDNFKYINDKFGHKKGDEVLIEFAWLLQKYFNNALIGRWGGDEFLICTDKSKQEIIYLITLINKDLEKIQSVFDKDKTRLLSVSAGGCSNTKTDIQKRFYKADLALYKVKKLGKKGIMFFEDLDYVKFEKEDINQTLNK